MRLQAASSSKQGKISAAALAAVMVLAGCGQTYRPVVSAINPVGPASQPTKFAVAVSSPSATSPGLVTFVDFSGDSILSTPQIVTNPSYFGIDAGGVYGFTVNTAGVFDDFALNNPIGLITSDIVQTALTANASPVSVTSYTVGSSSAIFIPEPGLSPAQVAVLTNPGSPSLVQSLAVGANPVYVVGTNSTERVYAISQNAPGTVGQIAAIEGSPVSISATILVGVKPVYGVMTPDTRRAFILNQGSGTVSVVNVINNALDNTTPTITLPNVTGSTLGPQPIWADLSPRIGGTVGNNQLVVLNKGDATHPGSLSIIDIPLCSQTAQSTNPNCNAANPVDATGFGSIFATVPVGYNPTMVSILQDGTRAYVINQGLLPGVVAAYPNGLPSSVSVVSLTTGLVTATITGDATSTVPTAVWGQNLNSVAATVGTPTGKVYVTSSDSRYMTVIRTDTDAVDTHVSLQGNGVRVLVTQP